MLIASMYCTLVSGRRSQDGISQSQRIISSLMEDLLEMFKSSYQGPVYQQKDV